MRANETGIVAILGFGALVLGVALAGGLPAALIVAGGLLLALAIADALEGRRGGRP